MEFAIYIEMFTRLAVAMLLGVLLGAERITAGKTAGMRTHALVSMGSALFVIVSVLVAADFAGKGNVNFDPLRVAAQVVTGIGFLGAGLIIFTGSKLRGLTTAAGLWVAAGIGMAAGFGFYIIAIFVTAITLLVFTLLWYVERSIKKWSKDYAQKKKDLAESE